MMKRAVVATSLLVALCGIALAGKNEDLQWAVSYHYLDKVGSYLDQGYDVNGRVQGGYTPLMIAAEQNHEDMVAYLLKRGADPSLRSDLGKKAIDYAYSQTIKNMLAKAEGLTTATTQTVPAPVATKAAAPAKAKAGTSASSDHCKKMYGMSYKLCDSSDYSCKVKAANNYSKCKKTGTWY